MSIHHLDPDFRPRLPKEPHCAQCRRKVNPRTARKAWVNWESWNVSLSRQEVAGDSAADMITHEFIGPDCWKEIGLPIT